MKLAKHVKIITLHLEILEDLKNNLETIVDYTKEIINEGQSWIDEKVTTKSFKQINQYLISETSKCIQKCLNIANENEDAASGETIIPNPSHHSDSTRTEGGFKDFKDESDTLLESQSKYLNLKERVKRQEKKNQIIASQCTDKYKKSEQQFEQIMKELQAASDFMSKIQSQTDLLTKANNENNMKFGDVLKKLNDHDEKIIMLATNQESCLVKYQVITDEMEVKIAKNQQLLQNDIQKISADLLYFKMSTDVATGSRTDVLRNNVESEHSSTTSDVHSITDWLALRKGNVLPGRKDTSVRKIEK